MSQKAIKVHVLANFLAAHSEPDIAFSYRPLSKEVSMLKKDEKCILTVLSWAN